MTLVPEVVAIAGAIVPLVQEIVAAFRKYDDNQAQEFGAEVEQILIQYAQVEPLQAVVRGLKVQSRIEGWATGPQDNTPTQGQP